MQCPVCDQVDLAMSNREGIEIDYCPKCRGVWLDRGELDKIIERSAPTAQPQPTRAAEPHYQEQRYQEKHYKSDKYSDRDHYKRKKKKSLLGELFDF